MYTEMTSQVNLIEHITNQSKINNKIISQIYLYLNPYTLKYYNIFKRMN